MREGIRCHPSKQLCAGMNTVYVQECPNVPLHWKEMGSVSKGEHALVPSVCINPEQKQHYVKMLAEAGKKVSLSTVKPVKPVLYQHGPKAREKKLLPKQHKKPDYSFSNPHSMAISIAILDCDLLLHGRGHKTLDRFDLDSVSDDFLLTHFSFPRNFILYLVELLRESLSRRTQRSRAISPEVQILAALGFYTSGSFQTSMGDTIGISQASMSRCVSHVTKALVEKASQFIAFSRDPSTREQSFRDFQRVAGFPGVLGVLDCVQVAIKAPNSEDSSYVNKKGFHSVACQLVCDVRGLLLSAETHWPGGLQDTDVLERSALYKQMQDNEEGWLLGDGRYPLRKWLMTPVECPDHAAEFQYNLAHAATHEIVDRTFRAIQTRFRCLDGTKGYLQYSPERSASILLACCVLHNASLKSGLDAWTLERTEPLEQHKSLKQRPEDRDSQAEELRKQLILKHFS